MASGSNLFAAKPSSPCRWFSLHLSICGICFELQVCGFTFVSPRESHKNLALPLDMEAKLMVHKRRSTTTDLQQRQLCPVHVVSELTDSVVSQHDSSGSRRTCRHHITLSSRPYNHIQAEAKAHEQLSSSIHPLKHSRTNSKLCFRPMSRRQQLHLC